MSSEPFLGRWSRRKHAARRGEALPEPAPDAKPERGPPPAPAAVAAAGRAEAAPLELPPLDSLKGLASEYREFLRPEVDPATRSAALGKLFGDPHFNQMDGLDVYIDDYSKADPIPTAMLRRLSQARSLGLFNEEKEAEQPAGEPVAPPTQPAAIAAMPEPEQPATSANSAQIAVPEPEAGST